MAYDIVDGCTYAFGKSLIIKGRRDTAVLSGIVVYQPINLFRTHAFTDMGCNMVQDGSIQVRAFLNCLDLLRRLKQRAIRNNLSLCGQGP